MKTHAVRTLVAIAAVAGAGALSPAGVAFAAGSGYGPQTPASSGSVSFPTVVTSQTLGRSGGRVQGRTAIGTITVAIAAGQLRVPSQVTVTEADTPGDVSSTADGCARTIDAVQVTVTPVAGAAGASRAANPTVTTTLASARLSGDGMSVVARGSDWSKPVTPAHGSLTVATAAPVQLVISSTAPCVGHGRLTSRSVAGPGGDSAIARAGGLPVTGLPVGALGTLAAALLALGGLAIALTRRRRP